MLAALALAIVVAVGSSALSPAGGALRVEAQATVHRAAVAALARIEMAQVIGEPRLTTAHFVVAYPAGHELDAHIVAASLERYYPEVTAHFGVHPSGRLPVRVETAAVMGKSFRADASNAPIGAYWRGVLWFLAPSDWIGTSQSAYNRYGPVPHELAHEMDDLKTAGRLPPWLDEGIAQYEEWRDNGYVWRDRANRLNQPLYSWAQLQGHFDRLQNQALAYRQSLLVVRQLGATGIGRLLDGIAAGESADRALEAVVGPVRYHALAAGAAWRSQGSRARTASGPSGTGPA